MATVTGSQLTKSLTLNNLTTTGVVNLGNSATVTGDLLVTNQIETPVLDWKDSHSKTFSKQFGVASYWAAGEYFEIMTITPSGASQNYSVKGQFYSTISQNTDIFEFECGVRSNTLPDIGWTLSYTKLTDFYDIKLATWYDSTNGIIKLVAQNVSASSLHNVNANFTLNQRAEYNNEDVSNVSEILTIPVGFTETDGIFIEYLPLTGGTLTGDLIFNNGPDIHLIEDSWLYFDKTGFDSYRINHASTNIDFYNQTQGKYADIRVGNLTAELGATILGNTVWHAGNDGIGTGLDADLLDAQQGTYYLDWNNFTSTPTTLSGYGINDSIKSLNDVHTIMTPTDGQILTWDNSNSYWTSIDAPTGAVGIQETYEYISTAAQTTFTGADENAQVLAYSPGNIYVIVDGFHLSTTSYTAINGTSIILNTGLDAGQEVSIFVFEEFILTTAIPKTVGIAKGDLIGFTSSAAPANITIGSNDDFLIADSSTATGIKWGNSIANLTVTNTINTVDILVTGTLTETSALKYKENIKPLLSSLEKVQQLTGVSYNKIGSTKQEIGLIADDVYQVIPEVVTIDNNEIEGINYARLTALLIESVKELKEEINILKEEITILKDDK